MYCAQMWYSLKGLGRVCEFLVRIDKRMVLPSLSMEKEFVIPYFESVLRYFLVVHH